MPILIPRAQSVTLDGSGNGTVSFTVDNTNQRWVIQSLLVRTSQAAAAVPVPRADLYMNGTGSQQWRGGTSNGNADTARGTAVLYPDDTLYVVWSGGIPGTVATATIGGSFDPAGLQLADADGGAMLLFQNATVSIGGQTVALNVSAATVNAEITGQTASLDVSAATVNINPAAGYILPGQTTTISQDLTSHPINPGLTLSYGLTDVSKYTSVNILLNAFANSQSTAGAAITGQLRLLWYDDNLGANLVYAEDVSFWLSNAIGNTLPIRGSSPVHGHYLQIQITNPGSAGAVTTNNLTVTGSFRTPVYSSWRQATPGASQITINGVTVGQMSYASSYSNNLGNIPNVTPGTGLRAYPIGFFSGPVWFQYAIITAALVNTPTIVDMSYVTSGNLAAGTAQPGYIYTGPNTAGQSDKGVINLPRSPCMLVVNPAATSSIQFSAVGQQGY